MKKKLLSLIILAGATIAFAHAINKVISNLSKDSGPLNAFDGYFYDSFLGKTQFTKQGQGPAILLIHDIHPLSSSYFMQPLADTLASKYTVYSLDLPGCGQSYTLEKSHTSFEYGLFIQKFIEDVIKSETTVFLNENATLSGLVAASDMLCEDFSMIKELYLINPSPFHYYGKKQSFTEFLLEKVLKLPVVGTSVYNLLFSRMNIKQNILEKIYPSISKAHQWYLDAAYQGGHLGESQGKDLYISLLSKELNGDCAKLLSQVSIPVRILYSEDFPLSTKIEYEGILPSIQSYLIKDIPISIPIDGGFQVLDILES